MPIKPENKHRYPPRHEWLSIREKILKRANHHCEFCGVKNYAVRMNARIVLAVAHLDQKPENNHPPQFSGVMPKMSFST